MGIDINKLAQLVRNLVSFYVVDKETRAEIAGMTDEKVLQYAEDAVNRAEAKNEEFINRLKAEGETDEKV